MKVRRHLGWLVESKHPNLRVTSGLVYAGLLLTMAMVEIWMTTVPVGAAVSLIRDTGVAAALTLTFIVLLGLCAAPVHRRILQPALHWRSCATLGAVDDVYHRSLGVFCAAALPRLERAHARAGSVDPARQAERTRIASGAASRASAWLVIVFVPMLWLAGHLPVSPLWILAAVVTAAALLIGLGPARDTQTDRESRTTTSVRWGARSLAAAIALEIVAAGGIVFILWVLQHTAGVPASGVGEAFAVALVARSLLHVSPVPMGLGLVDVVLIAGLTLIGTTLPIAIATAVLWRVSTVIVLVAELALVSWAGRQLPLDAIDDRAPTESRWGQFLHRCAFHAVGVLPEVAASAVRRRVFEFMFRSGADPWAYETSAYESRKRDVLVGTVPAGAAVVLEFGCADGHNLVALATERPAATIIGVDVSAAAVEVAQAKANHFANVTVLRADASECIDLLSDYRGRVDVLIVSEVLYYLGGAKALRRAIGPLAQLLAPDATVVLLHGGSDAPSLHATACASLGITARSDRVVEDPDRAFTLTVATTASTTAC